MSSLQKPTEQALVRGTLAQLQAIASASPSSIFICVATDIKSLLFYSGDPAAGNLGFFTLSSYTPLS